jgi:hypothetical protein
MYKILVMTAVLAVMSIPSVSAQQIDRDYDDKDYRDVDRARIDRYLDVEIWPNHSDGEYYEGDNVVIHFRSNRDAFVVIYSIDSRGRVNLLFPSEPGQDNYIKAGVSYRLPDGLDDFDLVVTGPEGMENIQIIASRERFPIPDWYPTSGLICDWDDRHEYMDYLNERNFIRYDGQRFSYDRTAIYVNEWEQYYYRPVYDPYYYPWTIYGNMYIDYPFGSSIYVDGIYWGCAPLYIPRLYVGWHTFTVYDHYGYCWESGVHVTRYHTVVLDRHVIRTSPTVVSKYKEVRFAGYRNPVSHGYPQYKEKRKAILKAAGMKNGAPVSKKSDTFFAGAKKHTRGTTKLVKTDRGYETTGAVYGKGKNVKATYSGNSTYSGSKGSSTGKYKDRGSSSYPKSAVYGKGKSTGQKSYQKTKSTTGSSSGKKSSGYYQKKSGSGYKGKSGTKRSKATYKSGKSKGGGKSSNVGKSSSKSGGKSKGTAPSYKPSGGGSKPSGKSSSSVGSRKSSGKSGSSSGGKSSRSPRGKGKK